MHRHMKTERLSLSVLFIFLLISTVSLSGCGGGGGGGSISGQQTSDVSYSGNRVTVPNGTVVYKGQSYTGEASVPQSSLVGIYKNGKAYLFHTDMAQANLDDTTSKRAIGYFIANQSVKNNLSKNFKLASSYSSTI
jgi:hypothetical protein